MITHKNSYKSLILFVVSETRKDDRLKRKINKIQDHKNQNRERLTL